MAEPSGIIDKGVKNQQRLILYWVYRAIMVASFSVPFVVVLVIAAQQDAPASRWTKFVAPDRSFSIDFPQKPKQKSKRLKSPGGPLTIKTYLVNSAKAKTAWFVSYSEKPAGKADSVRPAAHLYRAKKAALQTTKGKLKEEKKINVAGKPGLELLIVTKKGKYFRTRICFINNRLYQIFLVGPREQVVSDNADHFLKSFKVLSP